MLRNKIILPLLIVAMALGCKAPQVADMPASPSLPGRFAAASDTVSVAAMPWRDFLSDPDLAALIDTALAHNQELKVLEQEIEIARNDIRMRKGALLPTVGVKAGAGLEKVGRYTSQGAGDATTEILPGREMPEPLPDFGIAAQAHWEADIWKKLRNSKKAAFDRYLATQEGRNFAVTHLIAEIAEAYYELLALDNQLAIVQQNIALQQNGLEIVKVQKQAARATELAVQKFTAEVRSSQSLEFALRQRIRETENRIHFLLGRYPEPIVRHADDFISRSIQPLKAGIPSQLLANRPDIRQAELQLAAAKLDVKAARAEFYPSLDISASLGLQAFQPRYLFRVPESLLYSLSGDLLAPLINRNAIKAEYANANARQLQALFDYEKTVLGAFLDVSNRLSQLDNLDKSYGLKVEQVAALNTSVEVASDLFRSARADYLEVLLTQRDALEAKLELVATKKEQLTAAVQLYRDLGGGWK